MLRTRGPESIRAAVPRPGRAGNRGVAVLVLVAASAHVWMLAVHDHGPWLSVLLLAMTALCLKCAAGAWFKPGVSELGPIMGMSLGMAVLHAALALGVPGGTGGHDHAAAGYGAANTAAGLMLGIVVLELAVAFAAALALRAGRTAGN
ncbi:hypothetical protein GCM10023166_14880 [Paeniglutamicibacter cryotolerans]